MPVAGCNRWVDKSLYIQAYYFTITHYFNWEPNKNLWNWYAGHLLIIPVYYGKHPFSYPLLLHRASVSPGHGSDHVMCVFLTHNGPVLQMFPPVSLSRAYSPTCASVTVLREPQCVCLSTSQSVSLRKNILLETICHVEDLEKLPFPGDFCWTTRTHTNTHMHIQTATKVVPWLFD